MALTPITITFGTGLAPVVNPDSSLASGALTFTLMLAGVPVTMQDSVSGELVLPSPIVAAIDQGQLLSNPAGGAGYEPFTLLANDDSTTLPVGTYYNVHEELVAGSLPDWPFTVHHASAGGVQSIASQRPVP